MKILKPDRRLRAQDVDHLSNTTGLAHHWALTYNLLKVVRSPRLGKLLYPRPLSVVKRFR